MPRFNRNDVQVDQRIDSNFHLERLLSIKCINQPFENEYKLNDPLLLGTDLIYIFKIYYHRYRKRKGLM